MKETSLNLDFLYENDGKENQKEQTITRRRWVYDSNFTPRQEKNKVDTDLKEQELFKKHNVVGKGERTRQPWSMANGASKKFDLPYGKVGDKSERKETFLNYAAPSSLERFNKPLEPMTSNTYGFMGFPDGFMFKPKQPLRQQPSADVNRDVNRYFRKDSPKDFQSKPQDLPPFPPPPQQQMEQVRNDHPQPPMHPPPEPHRESPHPPPRLPSPREAPKHMSPPPPQPPAEVSESLRYRDIPPISERRRPVIPEQQRRNMTSADLRKYEQAFTDSESDRLLSQRKKEEAFFQKKEEQERERRNMKLYDPWGRPGCGAPKRVRQMQASYNPYGLPGGGAPLGDNRKMKFTEYQLERPHTPKYHEPPLPRYPNERRIGRGRTDFDMDFSSSPRRGADVLRDQEREISEKRRYLEKLEREKLMSRASWDDRKKRYENLNTQRGSDTLERQEREIRDKERELRNLRAMDDFSVPQPREPEYDMGRAQSVVKKSVFIVTTKSDKPTDLKIVGYVVKSEPQTDRQFRNREMNRRMFGHTDNLRPINYLGRSPRREPVGVFFGTNTTYKEDFDEPSQNKTPRPIERNPYKNNMVLFDPFGKAGGGAPMVNMTGQRDTRIKGMMGYLGREASGSAKAQHGFKTRQLAELQDQMAEQLKRREADRKYFQQPAIDYADNIRDKRVGYPRRNEYGLQSEKQHLPHSVSKPNPHRNYDEMMGLKQQLDAQSESLRMVRALDKQAEKHLERLHMDTFSKMYSGDYGGGNKKGPNLRKQKLDHIIHNPQQTNSYYNKVLVEGDNLMYDPDGYFDQFKPRITVNSTHRNLYEFPEGNIKMNYRGRAPYAEHGSY